MTSSLHVNLFVRAEMRSPAPVRLRVMAPVLAAALAAAFGILALMLRTLLAGTESDQIQTDQQKEGLAPRHQAVLELNARIATATAGLQQIERYRNARLEWSETLQALPAQVPGNLQFLEFTHDYPPQTQSAPGTPLLVPTNRVETGRVRISGRTTDSQSVALLLAAFRSPPLNRLLGEARVPPGAFRQEPRRRDSVPDVLLFDMDAICPPRRFE